MLSPALLLQQWAPESSSTPTSLALNSNIKKAVCGLPFVFFMFFVKNA
jgi:hypothetical protein